MRVNPKLFSVANEEEAVDVQEFDDRKVEVFIMDQYPSVKEEFINKGKFAVWSSMDGKNYRIFIEEGYYKELKDLYTQPINKIWVDFWDKCESVSQRMSKRVILPVTVVAVGACIGLSFVPGGYSLYLMIAVVIIAFGIMLFCNRFTRKKIYDENVASVELIKKSLGGEKKFDEIIERQKNYMDSYFDALYPDEEAEQLDEPVEAGEEAPAEVEVIEEEKSAEEQKDE